MKKFLIEIIGWLLFIGGIVMMVFLAFYHFRNPNFSVMMVFQILWKEYLIAMILITLGSVGLRNTLL